MIFFFINLYVDGKKPALDVGINVEDVYFEPSYGAIQSFNVYVEGKKKVYCFQNYDSKVGVYPLDYDPSFKYLDAQQRISENSHISPKKTDPCPMCGTMMLEAAGIQHFIAGTLVEPLHREIQCSSGHKFCFTCWSDYVQSQLKSDQGSGCLPCPAVGCGEILDLQWAPVILKRTDLVNRLIAQRQKHVIDTLHLHWCPVPDCGLLTRLESSETTANEATSLPPRTMICENGHATCLECKNESHTPCTCQEYLYYQELIKEETRDCDPNNSSDPLILISGHPFPRKCPKCNKELRKTEGCNIVL